MTRSRLPLRRLPCSALATLLAALAPAALAQAQGEAPFVDRVDVNVVNVEVFVTDRHGDPVGGLLKGDFQILEDGQPVEITNFYTVSWLDRMGGPPTGTATESSVPVEQRLNLAVYVDQSTLMPQDWRRISEELRQFLTAEAGRGTRILLATHDGKLEVLQPFTRDRVAVDDAFWVLRDVVPSGPVNEAQRRQAMQSMTLFARSARQSVASGDGQGAASSRDAAYDLIRSYVAKIEADLRRTSASLDTLMRSMAGLPGRRALLYVGGGLPQRPGEELFQHFQDLFVGFAGEVQSGSIIDPTLESLLTDETDLYRRVARTANAHQITLYTLDTSGTHGNDSLGADVDPLASASGVGGRTTLDALRAQNLREPLLAIAHGTGGVALAGAFSFEDRLAELARDFESYYSLGYRSPSGGDGKYHRIEVRVQHPGLEVRHREGYVDVPEGDRVADRTLSSLLAEIESNPLGIRVDVLEPEMVRGKKLHLPVLVRVPMASVALLPSGDLEKGSLHFYVVVKDEEGNVSDLHRHPYPVEVPSGQVEASRDQELAYLVTLEVRKGRPEVAVGVWDEISGEQSFVRKDVILERSRGG